MATRPPIRLRLPTLFGALGNVGSSDYLTITAGGGQRNFYKDRGDNGSI